MAILFYVEKKKKSFIDYFFFWRFMRKKLAQCSSFFFFFPCTSQRRQRCKASRKSNVTVWGEWCNLSFTKEVLWVQAVEVFEWDCGCLTSAGFFRYRCRRCCWFFCSQGHFTKRSKSYKKKLKKRKDGLGLCLLYLSLCVPPADQTSCDCVKKIKPQQHDSPSSITTLVMQRRPTPLFHGTVQNSPGLLSDLDEECAHTVTNWIVINMSIIRTNSTSQSSHNPRSHHQQINSSEAECFSIFLSCFSFTFFLLFKERKYRCLCKLHNIGCM